jgi:hypothetical protein
MIASSDCFYVMTGGCFSVRSGSVYFYATTRLRTSRSVDPSVQECPSSSGLTRVGASREASAIEGRELETGGWN